MELQALSWKITAHAVTSSQIAFYLYIPLHSRQAGIPPLPLHKLHAYIPPRWHTPSLSKAKSLPWTAQVNFYLEVLRGKKGTLREKSAHCHKQ